jgi:branched-chain amino acid aminotransferase
MKKHHNPPLSKFVWFDGKFISIDKAHVPITTHAIHYGTTVFEGIRAYWNSDNLYIFRLDDHIKRFRESGKYYSMSLNFSNKQIKNAMINLCRKNKIKESCYIRPFYFIGQYGISLHVTKYAPTHVAMFMFPFGDLFKKNGISVGITSWRKFSDASTPTQAKMGGNYLNSIIATQEIKKKGFDEAVLLDLQGNVSESPGENIFIIKNKILITPPIDSSALKGITRDSVFKIAKDLRYDIKIKKIKKDDLYLANEIFLCGTAAEIIPVTRINKKRVGNGKVGNITKEIMNRYIEIVMNKNKRYSKWLTGVY